MKNFLPVGGNKLKICMYIIQISLCFWDVWEKTWGEVEAPGIVTVSRSLEMFHWLFWQYAQQRYQGCEPWPSLWMANVCGTLYFWQMFLNSTSNHLCHLIMKIKFWMNHLWIKTIFQEDAAAIVSVTWSSKLCFREIMDRWLLCLFL